MQIPQTEIIVTKDGAEILRQTVPPGDYVIGREPECDVPIEVELVSRRHAQLTVNFDHAVIEDLGSSNGTFVNGKPVTEPARLWPNQKIQIGAATIELRRVKGGSSIDQTLTPQTEAVRLLLPEEILHERKYDIGGVVAQGGMGAILDAKDAATERRVAMKVMLDSSSPADLGRFVAEARVTAQLEHPSIVPVYELSVDDNGQPFYTMKMVRGITLRKVLELLAGGVPETVRKYPLPTLLTIFQKVCDAIAFAHSKGVIHRDLKPENIMLDDFGVVLVMDWGLAKVLGPGGRPAADAPTPGAEAAAPPILRTLPPAAASATLDGAIMGTPQYMSPEQARGETETLDARSDIYALGAILYYVLALRPPVTGDDAWAIVEKVARGQAEPLTASKSRPIPDSIAAVVRKAMAFDKERRYQQVAELQADLTAYQSGFATRAEQAGLGKQLLLALKRHKATAASIAAALLVLAAVVALAFVRVTREKNRAEGALADLQKAAPTLIAEGHKSIDGQQFDDALAKISFAVRIEPRNVAQRLLRAQLLQAMLRLDEAAAEFRQVLALGPESAAKDSAQANLALCQKLLHDYPNPEAFDRAAWQQLYAQMEKEGRSTQAAPIALKLGRAKDAADALLTARLVEWRKIPGWAKKPETDRVHWEKDGTLKLDFENVLIDDLSSLKALPLSNLNLGGTRVADLHPLSGMRLHKISWMGQKDRSVDLSPLKGMPLEEFAGDNFDSLTDLSVFSGMKLTSITVTGKQLHDLSALHGMPLKYVAITVSPVTTLHDLAASPITSLHVNSCSQLADISAVRKMPLRSIIMDATAVRDFSPLLDCATLNNAIVSRDLREIEVLRPHRGLRTLGYSFNKQKPAAEFWAEFDTLWRGRAQDADLRARIREAFVAAGLSEEDMKGVDRLADGSYHFNFDHAGSRMKKIPDLHGVPVSAMTMIGCTVTDLSPLAGLPVKTLNLRGIPAKSYDALRQCPRLESLTLGSNALRSLADLTGLKLKFLNVSTSPLADISSVAGMPLQELRLDHSKVADLSALSGLPLRVLRCEVSNVTDLGPLLSCPNLEMLCIPEKALNIGELRALKKLTRLSCKWDSGFDGPAQTADEFWKEYDAKKGAAK